MRHVCSNSRGLRRVRQLLTSAGAAILIAAVTFVPARLIGQAPNSKLSSVLAALASSVTQDQGLRPQSATSPARPLEVESLPQSVQDSIRGGWLRINANNEVQVYILVSAVSDEVVSALTAGGAVVELQDRARRRVQARVPVSRLRAIAQLPFVTAIRLPTYGRRHTGATATEGDAILHADAVRAQLAIDGTGVRVGVISDGIKGVFASGCVASCAGVDGGPISSGDLPTAVGARTASGVLMSSTGGIVGRSFRANNDLEGLPAASCTVPGIGAEGTALLEIVHDLAPGAKLSFANFDTDLEFIQAVNFLAESNDVVLDDISFFGEPYDGTSAVSTNTAAALNNPSFPIRAYFTSAGNAADEHYLAPYTDSRIDGTTVSGITNTGHLHLFQRTADTTDTLGLGSQTFNVVSLPQNGEVAIFLNWDDPFGASSNNYDLYLVQQSTGGVVASSTDTQSGGQDPVEFIDFVNRGSPDTFRIVVQNVRDAAQPRTLNLFTFQPECATAGPLLLSPGRHERLNYNTPSRSLAAQSDAGGSPVSVVSVGAICSASAAAAAQFSGGSNESCNDTSNSTIEFFSSRGPTVDGRVKPDVSAIDGVSVSGAGGFGKVFFGTSAAVAHLGGVAALALQSAPCLLSRTAATTSADVARSQLRSMILNSAVALSPTPPDTIFGSGRVDALAAVQPTLPTRTGSSSMTLDGNSPLGASLTAAQLGFSDPDQCNLTSLTWTGGCGTSPGTTMTCPFGASSVTVSASNNGVAFGGGSDLNITVTDFSTDVTPGDAALGSGHSATFVVTVAPQGGPYRSPVALGCNTATLPPGVTCSFSPSTVTPNNAPAQSVLTVSTTASSLLQPGYLDWQRDEPGSLPVVIKALLVWALGLAAIGVGVQAARRWRPVFVATACVGLAGLTQLALRVSASAMASAIAVFPGTLTFGSQTVGTTAPAQIVRVTNTGADSLTLTITAGGDFSQVTNCGSTLSSGDNCSIAISFTPTAAGSRTGSLTLVDNAPGSPHTVALSGTGVAAPMAGSGTPAGSYTLSVTATAGTLTHSVPLTLTVQ
jgi:subtilase family protein/ASPM-SPD-2-Hydin domain-containing protein